MSITASAVALFSDNYAWLLRETTTGATAIVDPADPDPIIAAIEAAGGRLDLILLTHHHADHVAGTDTVRARFGAPVVGHAADRARLPKLDRPVSDGDAVALGAASLRVIATPGHTQGQVAFYAAEGGVLLCADTLFALGCGRVMEATATDLYASLCRLASLPDATLVCCGHEYTLSNARFALTEEPENQALRHRAAETERLRAAGQPTVPSRIGEERATNPFLRVANAAAFAAMRARKDRF